MALVNVLHLAHQQFESPKYNEIYAYYRFEDEKLTLVERPDPDSIRPTDEKLGIDTIDRIHVPIPDNLTEYLSAVCDGVKKELSRVYAEASEEFRKELDAHWGSIQETITGK